jgi:predicted PurR-regulated permease PerM
VNPRSAALFVLTAIAVMFVLQQAKEILMPVVLAALISFTLNPVVARLKDWRIPRSITAGILLTIIVGLIAFSSYTFGDELTEIVNQLPQGAQNLRQLVREKIREKTPFKKMQEAAHEIESAAKEAAGQPASPSQPPAPAPSFNLQTYLVSGWLGAFDFVTQAVIILFLAYFFMVTGELLKRKVVRIAGSEFADKKATVEILNEIDSQISKFLQLQFFISVLVGIVSGVALAWIGVDHAGAWGLANALATWIPYFGPTVITAIIFVVSFLQFGTIGMAMLVAAVLIAIRTLEGMMLVPWLTGRIAHMNSAAVFIALLFWGWIWGTWGLLLAAPIMMVCKAVCDRIEGLKGIGELLGD